MFLFLYTDNFERDYQAYKAKGVMFVREPKEEPYGTVAVFKDLYGNLWDLLQPRAPQPNADAYPFHRGGRPTSGFACCRPPLMSNVRSQ